MLQYDRQITISQAGSRRATSWAASTMMWSEFLTRLQLPARGTETLAQYLAMPKSQQDDLKDVGGFVGGTLAGNRRKAGCVLGRDLLTLDLDAIPAGATQEALRRLESLGCACVAYSTRKHRPEAPRLRVVFPANRTVTSDEYEPLLRKLAEAAGLLEWCDPTTYEAHRLMYYPSCCADSEYIFHAADKPFLSANGVLALYPNWRDVSGWPGIVARPKPAGRQQDPTAKDGVVGAFCRVYDVEAAMATFLPGVYEPAGEGRYTFTGGSTEGGAVVYDNGLFLYSHHATDPCGGKLVNAFDLIRLHLFGELDDEATPGTLPHQLPSYKSMVELAKRDPPTATLFAEERGREILQAFDGSAQPSSEQLAHFLGGLKGEVLTTSVVRTLLELQGIRIRLNEITWQVEPEGYPQEWSRANAENLLPVKLLDQLRLAGVKGAAKGNVCDCLDVIAEEGRFNPVLEMVLQERWDGQDRIEEIYDIWNIDDPFSRTLIRKWLIQCIAMACNDELNPYGGDGMLVLQGKQGLGKTGALKALVPIPRMFKVGAQLTLREKDTIIQTLNSWICELGEVERTTMKDVAGIKAFITQDLDEYRTPYARKSVQRPRRTSLCGTANRAGYLIDETGSRRFWTVPITHIDLERLFALSDGWKRQLWAQAYSLYLERPQGFRLTQEEQAQLRIVNTNFTRPLDFEVELRDTFNWSLPPDQWGEFSAGEVAGRMQSRPPANRLGIILTKLMEEDGRITSRIRDGRTLYRIPMQKFPAQVEYLTGAQSGEVGIK